MKSPQPHARTGLIQSVFVAYFILLLHVLLIAGLGVLVIFFRGIVQYMIWIFLFGTAAAAVSAIWFYRRMKTEGKNISEILQSPIFKGRSVEVSLLGGLATMRFGNSGKEPPEIESGVIGPERQLEDPALSRVRELSELARLLEERYITLEEYNRTKGQIFNSGSRSRNS